MRKDGEMEGGRLHRGAHERSPEGDDAESAGAATEEPAYDDYGRAFTPRGEGGWPGRRTLLTKRDRGAPPAVARKRRALAETARGVSTALGLPAAWGQVAQDAAADQRLAGPAARGLASATRIDIASTLDVADADGRRVVAHELAHVAQMRLPSSGADLTDEAELEAEEIGREFAETGRLRKPVVPLPSSAIAADTGARAVVREADLPTLDARQAFNPVIVNVNAQFMQIEAMVKSIPGGETAAGAAVIQSAKEHYINAARVSRVRLLNHVPPLIHSGHVEAAGLELTRLMFAAQLMGLFTRVLSVASYAHASGAPAGAVAQAIAELDKLFGKTLDLASSENPALFRAAVATAPLLVRRVEDVLAAAVPRIAADAEMARKVMVAVQVASIAISLYQLWRTPVVGGGGGGGIAGVSGGGAVIASANGGQLLQLVAAVRQLVAIGALDATLVTTIGALGSGPQARPEPMQSSGVPPGNPPAPSAGRATRMAELSKDPDNNGKVTPKSTNEAGVMLDMEDAGRLPGPVRRPNRQMGESGDVVDASGQQWDIKSLKDRATIRQIRIAKGQPVPPPHVPLRGEFDVATEIQRLRGQIASGEKVIFDMRGISAADQLTLRNAVTQAGLDAHVLYYP